MSDASLCVVVHDVADATLAACERLVGAIAEIASVPLTLLAVPRYHHDTPSPALEQWLGARSRNGDEIALHGYTHVDEGTPHGYVDRLRRRVYTRGEGEFWDLAVDDAAARLHAGADWFERNGWPLHGFVAPAWLLGPGAWQALSGMGLAYTSTLRHIHLLPARGRITSQSLVYSTGSVWRRQSSIAWVSAVDAAQAQNPVLRLELHPRDADHASVRNSWQRVLASELDRREALTVERLSARWRETGRAGREDAGLRAD